MRISLLEQLINKSFKNFLEAEVKTGAINVPTGRPTPGAADIARQKWAARDGARMAGLAQSANASGKVSPETVRNFKQPAQPLTNASRTFVSQQPTAAKSKEEQMIDTRAQEDIAAGRVPQKPNDPAKAKALETQWIAKYGQFPASTQTKSPQAPPINPSEYPGVNPAAIARQNARQNARQATAPKLTPPSFRDTVDRLTKQSTSTPPPPPSPNTLRDVVAARANMQAKQPTSKNGNGVQTTSGFVGGGGVAPSAQSAPVQNTNSQFKTKTPAEEVELRRSFGLSDKVAPLNYSALHNGGNYDQFKKDNLNAQSPERATYNISDPSSLSAEDKKKNNINASPAGGGSAITQW